MPKKYRIKVANMWATGVFYKCREYYCEEDSGFMSIDGLTWARMGIVQEWEEVDV